MCGMKQLSDQCGGGGDDDVVGDVVEPFTRRAGELPRGLSQARREAPVDGRVRRCVSGRRRHQRASVRRKYLIRRLHS